MDRATQKDMAFRPGFQPRRLVTLMQDAIERCHLNLTGNIVLTEAATGAYVVTPVLAALAGATKVFAITKDTHYGTVQQVSDQTRHLARLAGVEAHIEIITEKTQQMVAQSDIITNSGHVRPIDAETINWMKPSAVIPLMYETWELRARDVDLDACRQRGIAVAGTNECHPAVDVFSYLGMMAVKLLLDAGVAVHGSHLLLLCDNPFKPYLEFGLRGAGANVKVAREKYELLFDMKFDAIVVALNPSFQVPIGTAEALVSAAEIAARWPGVIVAQFWGDLDRQALDAERVSYWPTSPVPSGHMGVIPAAIGPEPVIRLQSGGLKTGELLARGAFRPGDPDAAFLQIL
jgi:hypothetical protein